MSVVATHTAETAAAMTARPADEEIDLFGITDRGKVRPDNQDHFLIGTVHQQLLIRATSLPNHEHLPLRGDRIATFMMVADGVGGAAEGSEAARLAVQATTRYLSSAM